MENVIQKTIYVSSNKELLWYDGPQLVSYEVNNDENIIAIHIPCLENEYKMLVSHISSNDMTSLENGQIDLLTAMIGEDENKDVFITDLCDANTVDEKTGKMILTFVGKACDARMSHPDWFPDEDLFLE